MPQLAPSPLEHGHQPPSTETRTRESSPTSSHSGTSPSLGRTNSSNTSIDTVAPQPYTIQDHLSQITEQKRQILDLCGVGSHLALSAAIEVKSDGTSDLINLDGVAQWLKEWRDKKKALRGDAEGAWCALSCVDCRSVEQVTPQLPVPLRPSED